MEATLDTLRRVTEINRDKMSPNINAPTYQQLLASGALSHEEIQTYLLLKILDRLEAIEKQMWKENG